MNIITPKISTKSKLVTRRVEDFSKFDCIVCGNILDGLKKLEMKVKKIGQECR